MPTTKIFKSNWEKEKEKTLFFFDNTLIDSNKSKQFINEDSVPLLLFVIICH
jgi:hypothetical protein